MSEQNLSNKNINTSNNVDFDVKFQTQMECKQVELLSHKDIDELLAKKGGQRYWDYRKAWEKGMTLKEVPEFPLTIDFENLNHCNFACHHCMFSARHAHPDLKNRVGDKMMDFDLYKRAIDEGSEYGLPAITHGVQCEPLMHPDIVKKVAYADKKGVIDQRIGSNGSLLDTEMAEKLIDSGLSRLEISLDAATPETFKKVRKGKEAIFENIVRNTHNFLNIRSKRNSVFPLLRVSFVKMNINKHEVKAFTNYWKDYADYFSLQEVINYDMNLPNTAIKFNEKSEKDGFRCDKPFLRMFMRYNGGFYPCFPLNLPGFDDFSLGNIKNNTIKQAWDSQFENYLRDLHKKRCYKDNEVCHQCVRRTEVFHDEGEVFPSQT